MAKDFTPEDLATLNAAIASGVRVVRYKDREVGYQTLDEMMKVRDRMVRDLDQRAGKPTGGSRLRRVQFRRG